MAIKLKKSVKKAIKDSGPAQPMTPKEKKIYTAFALREASKESFEQGYKEGQRNPPMAPAEYISDKERQENATAAKIVADRLIELSDLIDYHNKIVSSLSEQYHFLKSTSPQSALNINRPSSPVYPGSQPAWVIK